MKNFSFLVASMAAFLMLGGCTIAASKAVQYANFAEELGKDKIFALKTWYSQQREMSGRMTTNIIQQAEAKILAGDLNAGLELYEQAQKIHQNSKPQFLIQKLRKGSREPSDTADGGSADGD